MSYTRAIAYWIAIRVDGTRFGRRDLHRVAINPVAAAKIGVEVAYLTVKPVPITVGLDPQQVSHRWAVIVPEVIGFGH